MNLCLFYMPRSLDRCGRPRGHRGKHANIDAVAHERATQPARSMKYRATAKGQLNHLRSHANERGNR